MEKVNSTIKIHIQIISFLLIWMVIVFFTKSFSTTDLLPVIKKIPQAISIYVFLGIIFVKWIWKWEIFQGWLIKIPNLEGTWRGQIKSDWINPETQRVADPIPVILVIKQTFLNIKCALMTKESTSYSTTADFDFIHGGDDIYLSYTYTNRSKATIRDRSAMHDGASILKVIKKPSKTLEGEYWTSRKTRGEIDLHFESKEFAEKFYD